MGITRQSVQRVADLLVREGLAAYAPNPAHRRAKLLTPTEAGRAAVRRIDPGHAELAALLMRELGGQERLRRDGTRPGAAVDGHGHGQRELPGTSVARVNRQEVASSSVTVLRRSSGWTKRSGPVGGNRHARGQVLPVRAGAGT
ncbi:hypothetical protein STANM309S_01878 [Streptomyces tanashiensis]